MASSGGPVISYTPEPHERPYYEALFATADTMRTGTIGGAQAVQFFGLSKLPVDALKQIWTLADTNPTTNSLDKRKFGIAIRLIQLQQNGQKAQGANLAAPPGVVLRPAMFEGVSGVTAPLPPTGPSAAPQQQQQSLPMQQQQQPPPRQQQPPPMPQQQQPSPTLQPMQPPPQQSTALTTQDPYTMVPHDQSRYEALFPQYEAKHDGYVYGSEAVALFSKSGLGQDQLRDIWNMVDQPVDNRLDKLEFAMAMHLIVCVSKKNLPMPPALPYSLKVLKQAQKQPMSPPQPKPSGFGSEMPSPGMQQGAPPSPTGRPPLHPPQQLGQPSPSLGPAATGMIPPPVPSQSLGGSMSSMPGPPPIQQQGGQSISDAFEGLSTSPSYESSLATPYIDAASPKAIPEPEPTSMPEPQSMGMSIPEPTNMTIPNAGSFGVPAATSSLSIPEPQMAAPEPAPAPPPAPPKDTKALAASYQMGDEHQELDKLKGTLQRLQAENIALKAQLGSMTEDEKEVQREIAATVAEIGSLSNELTGVRAKVLSAKTSLLEASSDLTKHKEKKEAVHDLITEARSTLNALDEANEAISNIQVQNEAPPQAPAPAAFEADLFSWDAPAPVAEAPAPAAMPAPAVVTPSEVHEEPPPPPAAPALVPPPPVDASPGGFGGMPLGSMPVNTQPTIYEAPAAMAPPPAPAADIAPAPSSEEVEGLKSKLQEAESTARDAEEQRRQLAEQADVLRRQADNAEKAAKQKQEAAAQAPKKRGFGRGKGKKDAKAVDKLLQDAADKKRQYMEAQAAAQHASQVAMETKFEADKIRKDAEKAELQAAQAASMADAPAPVPLQNSPVPQPVKQASIQSDFGNGSDMGSYRGSFSVMGGGGGPSIPTPSADAGTGGYGGMMGGGGGPGIPTPSADAGNGGYGGMGGGWAMGGGGGDDKGGIPTPPQSNVGDDPYANPF